MPSTGRDARVSCVQPVEIVGQTDLVFDVECFTDDSGTTFYGVWELDGGTLVLNFYTVDAGGNLTPYNPTSTPIPCIPNDIETTDECWVATADGVGYSTGDQVQEIRFWDTTTSPPTLTATVWYNQTTRTVIAAPPPQVDLEPCAFSSSVLPGCYEDPNGNFFDAVVTLNIDGTVNTMVIGNVVTDPAPGTLIVGRHCMPCCQESRDAETFQHVDLPHAEIATDDGFIAGSTQYNGRLCGDTIRLEPDDLTVVATEVATSPEPIFTWSGAANGGLHKIVLSASGTLRMGFASADGGMNETFEFTTSKPDRIFPGTGSSIASQAELDAATLPIVWDNNNSADPTYFEWDNVTAVSFIVNSQDTITCRAFVDSVTFDNANKWSEDCCGCDDTRKTPTSVGYIETCTPFDITLPINTDGTFSDNVGATTTLSASSSTIAQINAALLDALQYEESQIADGQTVTNFFIRTTGGDSFEFPPSARESATSTTITFTAADLIAWPGPLADNITQIEYSKFDGCTCRAVEMVQRVNVDTGEVVLVSVVDPSVTDDQGRKQEVEFEFGMTGPFAGPCPAEEQVIALDDLCCDSDLVANNPDVANLRLAWLDSDDVPLMTPQGGVIGGAVDGDLIVQVDDKLASGVNFVVPAAIAPGDDGVTPPFLRENQFGDRAALEFISTGGGTAGSRLRLDTGNPAGSSFTYFHLFSSTVSGANNQTILSVGPNNADGQEYFTVLGAWQFGRDGNLNHFVWRQQISLADAMPTIVTQVNPGPGDGLTPSGPGQNIDLGIIPLNQVYDGQLHLLTATYDNATSSLSVFFDGRLLLELDYTPTPDAAAAMASDYFRVFGNRGGDAFADGFLAEMFFADSLLTPAQIGIVNAYLICKWGIDPSLAAGGAGDLTLAPGGTYNTPTPLVRITKSNGSIVFRNVDTGLEFPVPPVPGLSVCEGDSEGCCTCPGLDVTYQVENAGAVNFPANTLHSLSVQVLTGTADVNGITIPAGPPINVEGDECQNNVGTAHTIDNFTGDTLIISTQY